MNKRQQIEKRLQHTKKQIELLQVIEYKLEKELLVMSDEKQWFTEEEEEIVISKRPKQVVKKLVGRIHWKEYFEDQDVPGNGLWVERSQAVRVNGKWLD